MLYCTGPVNNTLVVRRPIDSNPRNSQTSSKKHGSLLSPPLDKYLNSSDENRDAKALIVCQPTFSKSVDASYCSGHIIVDQIKELQVLIHVTSRYSNFYKLFFLLNSFLAFFCVYSYNTACTLARPFGSEGVNLASVYVVFNLSIGDKFFWI